MFAINNQMISFDTVNKMQKGNELPKPYFEIIERLLNGQVKPKLELRRDFFVNYKNLILKRGCALETFGGFQKYVCFSCSGTYR
jgi:hypothetical protein